VEVAAHGRTRAARIAPETAAAVSAWIVRQALGQPDRRRGFVAAAGDDRVGRGDGPIAGQRGLDLHVQRGAVVHVAAFVTRQQEMPGALGGIGAAEGVDDLLRVDGADDVSGRLDTVLRSGQNGPVALVLGPTARDIERAGLVHKRPVPVDELGTAEIAVRVDPAAVLDVNDVSGRHRVLGQIAGHGCGRVTRRGRRVAELRHVFVVVAVTAAPGVVAIVREQDEHRTRGVVGPGDLIDAAGPEGRVPFLPAHGVRSRNHDDLRDDSALRFDVFGSVGREAIGVGNLEGDTSRDEVGGPVVLRGVDPIGRVGGIAVVLIGVVGIVGAGSGDVQVRHDSPRDSGFDQGGNQTFAEAGLGRKESRREIVVPPGVVVDGFLAGEFHSKGVIVHQRGDAVMKSDKDRFQTRAAARGQPAAGLTVVRVPVRRVTPSVPVVITQAEEILDQRAGEGDLGARLWEIQDQGDGVPGVPLIVRHPVVLVEDRKDIVLAMSEGDGLIRDLIATGRPSACVRPVDGLMHVPQISGVHSGGAKPDSRQNKSDQPGQDRPRRRRATPRRDGWESQAAEDVAHER
jgi:hypothetical protein